MICRRIPDGDQALGYAVNLLQLHAPFGNMQFKALVSTLIGQVRRRHYVFTVKDDKPVGYGGWALCAEDVAEAWMERRHTPSFAECVDGDCFVGLTWYAATREANAFQSRHLRDLYPGRKVYWRRDLAAGPKLVRVFNKGPADGPERS